MIVVGIKTSPSVLAAGHWSESVKVELPLLCGLFLTWRRDFHIHYGCLKSRVEWYGKPSCFLIKSTPSLSMLLIVAEPMVTGKSNRSLFISITASCVTTAWKEPISHGRRTNTPLRVSVTFVWPSFHSLTSSETVSPPSSLSFSFRASSNQVGELFRDSSERLPQTAEPPGVWRGHHPSGPRLW